MRREAAVPVATVWRAPDSPRDVDDPAVRDAPDVAGWAASMGREVRLGLHGRTDTQLLMGEPVEVLEERDGWTRVAAPWQASSRDGRGYPGWVRSTHLAEPVGDRRGASATVLDRSARCTVRGAEIDLSFGTVLRLASVAGDAVVVHLPGGRMGEMAPGTVLLGAEEPRPVDDTGRLLAAARQFLGVRYLWGGTSGWGLDCSGLVHLALRAFGWRLPRDAADQADAADVETVALDDVRPGDLYFFARPGERVYHVGFVTRAVAADGTRWMLHAPEGGELIEDAPLAPHRVDHLVAAGRLRATG